MSKFIKLSEIADVITGFPFKGDQYSDYGIRTVRGENVTEGSLRWDTIKCWNQKFEKEQEYLLKPDDVVIGMDGSKVGKNKARVKEKDLPLLLAQRVACVRAKEKNNQVFLYYLINNPRFETYVFQTQTGSSVPHISKSQIEDFEVPDFDPVTQQKIASVLSVIDDKIELNNRINAELEAMAKLVYAYWFVQFDFPVVTLSGVEGYKSSGGKMVWNEELKREIPEGWEVKTLKEIAKTGSGGTPLSNKREYYENGNIPWINSGEVNNPFIISSEKKITKAGLENSSAKLFPKGTILMAMYGATAGKVSLIDFEASTNQAICAIMPNQDVYRYFIKFKLETLYEFLVNLSSGSARDNLSQEKIRELKFVIPDSQILDNFHKTISPFMAKILENLKQNQQLSSLRDWLLPMLMNGQVRLDGLGDLVEKEELGMVAEPQETYQTSPSKG